MNKKGQDMSGIAISFLTIFVIGILFVFFAVVIPAMKPWWATQSGKAELAQAEQNRQIAVLEAQAKYESSIKLAQAEIERAKGVSEANKIIAGSITENYLRYLYVEGLQTNQMQTIYVPVDGMLPVFDMTEYQKK